MKYVKSILIVLMFLSGIAHGKSYVEKVADGSWLKVTTDNFIVITDHNQKTATRIIEDLENFRYYIRYFANLSYPNDALPLKYYIFKNEGLFKKAIKKKRYAGFYRDTRKGPLAAAFLHGFEEVADHMKDFGVQTLQHEYAHYAMSIGQNANILPRWYSEGMADYLSTFEVKGVEIEYGRPSQARIREIGYSKRSLSLEDTIKGVWNKKSNKSSHYAVSSLFLHYMNSDEKRKKQLKKYLQLIGGGETVDVAWEKSLGESFKKTQKKLLNYVKKNKFSYIAHVLEEKFKYAPPVFSPLSEEEKLAELLELEMASYWKGSETTVSDEFRERLSGLAKTRESKRVVAQSLIDDGKLEAASEYLTLSFDEKALADSEVLRMRSEIQMYSASSPGFNNAERKVRLLRARKLIRQSIKADKGNFSAFLTLGDIYSRLVLVDPTVKVDEGLVGYGEMNYYLDWSRVELGIGRLLAYSGDVERAKLYAEKVLRQAHISSLTVREAKVLTSLDKEGLLKLRALQSAVYSFDAAALSYNLQLLSLGIEEAGHHHNHVSWLYATSSNIEVRDPQKAIEYGIKAFELSGGDDSAILDTLAAAYASNSEFALAAKYQKLAVSLEKNPKTKKKFKEKLKSYLKEELYHI